MHSFAQLAALFEARLAKLPIQSRSPQNLYEPCRYLLSLGGKRIRPVLCLMATELFGAIGEDSWQAAAAVELFHNFTLIHDDIMDKAPLRRGKPTVHERNGLTAGILCGDVMNIHAYDALAQVKTALPAIFQLFNKTAIEVCEGQQMDMDFEQESTVSVEDYIRMITLKTSVLLACSLKMGAIIGGATSGAAGKLYEFGLNLGIAFQLQDDYLDAFGESAATGKQTGGDILANKKTYLLLAALEAADPAQKESMELLLKQEGGDKVGKMLGLFKSTGADTACREAVTAYSQKAFSSLEDLPVQSQRKTELHHLAEYLLMREG